MDKRLFDNSVSKTCTNCKFGILSDDGESILCKKKGVMELYDYCRRYQYDPTKRRPKLPMPTVEYNAEDFKL